MSATVHSLEPLTAAPSPAGPASEADLARPTPPEIPLPRSLQVLRFNIRHIEFVFRWRRELGDTFRFNGMVPGYPVITCHPDHVASLFKARPEIVPTLTSESPLRPIVGPASVLTANGPRHLRQRRLLLPPFHGEAIDRYTQMIERVVHREIDSWPLGSAFAVAPRMQSVTLDVIMAGIFGIEGAVQGRAGSSSPEHRFRAAIERLTMLSTSFLAQAGELLNVGKAEPVGFLKQGVRLLDSVTYPIIKARRALPPEELAARTDILSMIMCAVTEDGDPLTDAELRDELLTLVLVGFETTANSLSWTLERLVRTPDAYDQLRSAVREDDDAAGHVERALQEGMRARPVIPMIGRRPTVAWRLGDYAVPENSPITMSILLLHHREDLYPDPFAFRPDRWLGRKPGTYEWLPFGGGTRRCLGAALAMAEQRAVLNAVMQRLDLEADRPEAEHAQHRNVTMIPARGARMVVRHRTVAA